MEARIASMALFIRSVSRVYISRGLWCNNASRTVTLELSRSRQKGGIHIHCSCAPDVCSCLTGIHLGFNFRI